MINIAMTTGNSSRFIVTSWLLTPYCYVLQFFLYIYYIQIICLKCINFTAELFHWCKDGYVYL